MNKLFIFLACIMLCLTSCGFHLRGTTPLAQPLQRIYLKTPSPYDELTNNLRQYLKLSGAYITDSPYEADTVLNILSENATQQLLGVNGTQQTRQYSLTLSVKFQVENPNGTVLIAPETLSESRTLPINSGEVLAGSNQAAALYQQMRRAVVFAIVNRLSSQSITNQLMSRHHEDTLSATRTTTR